MFPGKIQVFIMTEPVLYRILFMGGRCANLRGLPRRRSGETVRQ